LRPRDHAAVTGDWVAFEPQDEQTGSVVAILSRRTQFLRKEPGQRTVEKTVAANVDTVFLVQGLDEDFNLRRMERYLSAAYESGARPLIVMTKADLRTPPELERRLGQVAGVALGAPIFAVSCTAAETDD